MPLVQLTNEEMEVSVYSCALASILGRLCLVGYFESCNRKLFEKPMRLNLMHKLTLMVVLPLLFEFIFVAVMVGLLKFSEYDLARVAKAKEVQSTCGKVLLQVYQADVAAFDNSIHPSEFSVTTFKQAQSQLPMLVDKLRSECSGNTEGQHSTELISILALRLLDLLSNVIDATSPLIGSTYADNAGFLTRRIVAEIYGLSSSQGKISSHLDSHIDWPTVIFTALALGLGASVIISLLVMRFIHGDLLKRIGIVRDNATKITEGDPLNPRVVGTDEIAELDDLVHEMHEELLQSEGQRRDVISMLAHDMRVPLTSLALLLSRIVAGKYESNLIERREKVKKFLPELERVNRMIDDLLTFEKLNSGKLRLIKERFPVLQLFQEIADLLAIGVELKQVQFDLQCEANLYITADRYQVKRVLVNLSENAVKHSPQGGNVTLKAARDPALVRIDVMDEGPGIPEESMGALFEKFEQGSEADSRKGFGLGLAISRAIIEMHDGEIGVRNRSDRSGADFYFSLPVRE